MKLIKIICSLLVIFAVLTLPLWLKLYVVNGSSMDPTLTSGTIMLVDTLSLKFISPHRGELLVIRNPHATYTTHEVDVKRVIGLPGETVHVRPDSVAINDTVYDSQTTIGGGGKSATNGISFDMVLGPHDYFVLGDNRADSSDSRLFGAVQQSDFIGRAAVSVWPLWRFTIL